jgi:hypothetical protein
MLIRNDPLQLVAESLSRSAPFRGKHNQSNQENMNLAAVKQSDGKGVHTCIVKMGFRLWLAPEYEREEGADEPELVLPPLGDPRAESVPLVVHEEPLLLDGHPPVSTGSPAPSPRSSGGGATVSTASPPDDAAVGGGCLASGEVGGGGVLESYPNEHGGDAAGEKWEVETRRRRCG